MAIDDLLDEHEQSERVKSWLRANGAGVYEHCDATNTLTWTQESNKARTKITGDSQGSSLMRGQS